MKYRNVIVAILVAAVCVAALSAWAGDEHKMEMKTVTLEGEILDMYCYMKHPADGQGAEHAKCATSCISKGLPIGLLVGDDVYLITGKDHESAAELVAGYAGAPVRVTGTVMEHSGVKAFEIQSIEKVKARG